jgi:tRNA-dihydrouridine synthase B
MIGRAAQGRPWIFREIEAYLRSGEVLPPPLVSEIHAVMRTHLDDLYSFYGVDTGVKIARKHIGWYTKGMAGSAQFRFAMNQLSEVSAQRAATDRYFAALAARDSRLRYTELPEELAA